MKILVTGSSGLIGSEAVRYFAKKGHQIIITNSRGPHTIDFAGQTGVKAVKIE